MPDPTHKAVSASQVGAMFNASRFGTRWTLWQHFVRGSPWYSDDNERTLAGRYFEPGILAYAAHDLRFDVVPYAAQEFVRHPNPDVPLGATRDASIMHPVWGPGIVEAKLVLANVYRERWTDEAPDPEVALQVQTALAVQPECQWAAIACFVEGGRGLVIYKVARNAELIDEIAAEARRFMRSVRDLIEPPVEGTEVELDVIAELWPVTTEGRALNVDDPKFDEACDAYLENGELRRHHQKLEKQALAYILGVAKDAQIIQSRDHQVFMRRDRNGKRLAPHIKLQERL